MKIAAIGEAMIELSMRGDSADVRVAGDTLNTAIYLKRTAPTLQVDYITRVGTDPFSDRIISAIEAEDIGTHAIERDATRTPGLYAITTDDAGERSFAYWRDASAARMVFATPSGPDFSVLETYDVIYTSAITLAILPASTRTALIRWLRAFRQTGGRVAFDSNYRPRLWGDPDAARAAISAMWMLSDIALPSIDDEMELTGESAQEVANRFVALGRSGALKRGADGPLCLETGTTSAYPPAEKVVDTTAAGDSFNGAYLGALLMGAPQDQALRAGHALASEVIGHRGAILPR
ncbi:sugar kinase [Tateyamaria omphalii]|uniref:sugar kinase n=1 Tax=Tateyamaria omphalii TaxID=299262 RepID=UPI001C99B9AB|nr:sugar kinase [Tateyamaria omphalii]MBY5933700.1 sugar kinase [Tateyamaria omphalii]